MAADSQPPEVQPNELFGRWLAHREQQVTDEPSDEQVPGKQPAAPDTEPRVPRRLPTAAVASSAVANDPVIGRRIAPPSDFGARRPAAHGGASEPDREPPPGWEPIVMRSARKKAEEPSPGERPGRLARIKARLVDPPEPVADAAPVADPPPAAPVPPPVVRQRAVPPPAVRTPPPAQPVAPPPASVPDEAPAPAPRSIEETIRAAVAPLVESKRPPVSRVERVVRPEPVVHVQPQPEPVVRPEPVVQPEPVARTQPEPLVVPEPVAVPEPVVRAEPVARAQPVPVVEPEPVVQAPPEPVIEPEPVVEAAPPPVAVRRAHRLVGRPRPPEPVAPVETDPVFVAEPAVEPEPEPESEPDTIQADPEPEPVPEPASTAARAPVAPVVEPNARKTFRLRPARASTGTPSHKAPTRSPRAGDAARDLVAAKAAARAASPAPAPERREPVAQPAMQPVTQPAMQPAPQPVMQPAMQPVTQPVTRPVTQGQVQVVEPEPAEVAAHKAEPASSKQDQVAEAMPGVYKFKPKRAVRRVLSVCLLGGLAASAYLVRAAAEVKETQAIGLATIIVLATAVVWAIRAGASVTTLTVRHGQLEVVQQGGKFVFDMASEYTMVEVHGRPGRRGWNVLFPRRGMEPFAVDATMVDPDDFMRVLRFFRPSLVQH